MTFILKKQSNDTSVKEEESNHSLKRKRTADSPAITEEDDEEIPQKKISLHMVCVLVGLFLQVVSCAVSKKELRLRQSRYNHFSGS